METLFAAMMVVFAESNEEFLKMAEERQNRGHEWVYVGRTLATDDYISLPAVEEDGTKVFYWEILDTSAEMTCAKCKPESQRN